MAGDGDPGAHASPITEMTGSRRGNGYAAVADRPNSDISISISKDGIGLGKAAAEAGVDNKDEEVSDPNPTVATHVSSSHDHLSVCNGKTTDSQPEDVPTVISSNGGSSNILEQNRGMLSRSWNLHMPSRRAKKLLVLDVNGLLVASYKKKEKRRPRGIPHSVVGSRCVFKRPFCDAFLKFCFEKFHVGIWSSMLEENVHKALGFICKETKHKLAFVMHQEDCTDTGLRSPENKYQPIYLKELRKVWSRFQPGEFDQTNTLLVDDTPYKALRNPPCTAIFPATYMHDETDNFLAGPLQEFLEDLSHASNVQEFVKSNPIGASAIVEGGPHWELYAKIVNTNASSPPKQVTIPDVQAPPNGSIYTPPWNRCQTQSAQIISQAPDVESLQERVRNLALTS